MVAVLAEPRGKLAHVVFTFKAAELAAPIGVRPG